MYAILSKHSQEDVKDSFLSKHLVSSFYWSGTRVSNKNSTYQGPSKRFIYTYYWSLKMQLETYINNFTQLGNKHSCQNNYVKLHKPFFKENIFQGDKVYKYRLSYFTHFFLFFFFSCVLWKAFQCVKSLSL